MGLFNKLFTRNISTELPTALAPKLKDLAYYTSDEFLRFEKEISDKINKAVNPASLLHDEVMNNDGSNYFGSEFDVRGLSRSLKQAYIKEPWIFGTANLIAKSLITVPLVVKDTASDEINDTHPLNEKIACGNAFQAHKEIEWAGNIDLILSGNFFQIYDEKYESCLHVQAENAEIVIDKATALPTMLKVYDECGNGKVRLVVPWERVLQFRLPSPFNPYYGMSAFMAASRPIVLDRMKNEYEMAFYLRGSSAPGVIETEEDLSRTRMKMLLRTYEQTYTGKRNWWRPTFLPKGAKWVNTGFTLQAMQHVELLKENKLSILVSLNVPPAKVGITEAVNRSNSEAQDKDFWQDTIKPISDFKAANINNSYLVKKIYGDKVYVEPDYSSIEALQGSLETKGKHAQSVERYLLIDEIRTDILGYEPLPENKGQVFSGEVTAQSSVPSLLGLAVTTEANTTLDMDAYKKEAEEQQNKIEVTVTKRFISNFNKVYLDKLYKLTEEALKKGYDVLSHLLENKGELEKSYIFAVGDVLEDALNRGFKFANNEAKSLSPKNVKSKKLKTKSLDKRSEKRLRFSNVDLEAIEALRQRTEEDELKTLVDRGISNFEGMNGTKTEQIMKIIADSFEAGQTTEEIAENIRREHQDRYGDQSFTIARTEVLGAVSQGLKWNQGILEQVFSKVEKQWFHVGDAGSNPDARLNHADFEALGSQDVSYIYGNQLRYPRDPNAPADETINCRCTMASIIPDTATSNAEIILRQGNL